jgi:hypothetical protein
VANVTVQDNIDPVAMCQDITVQLDATGNATIIADDLDNGNSDACGIASLSVNSTAFDCDSVGPRNVILTVEDNNGNTATCSSTVIVEDNVDPVALCQDISVYLDAAGDASIVASDVDGGSTDACGIDNLSVSNMFFDCDSLGIRTVILTVEDNKGNVSTCSSSVTIVDSLGACGLGSGIIYVDENKIAGANTGMNWDDAFLELYDALEAAKLNPSIGQIWVAAGTYMPTNGTDRDSVFALVDSVTVYGGFVGNEDFLHQRDIVANMTILSGNLGNSLSEFDNSFRVVEVASDINQAELNGLAIERGTSFEFLFLTTRGGGVGCFGELNMTDVTVRNCFGFDEGVAIWASGASASLKMTRCTVENNQTDVDIFADLDAEITIDEILTVKD